MTSLSALFVPAPLILAQAGGSPIQYFANSNLAGKLIILILLVLSFVAWTMMIGKYLDLSRRRELNRGVESRLQQTHSVFQLSPRAQGGPYGALVRAVVQAVERFQTDAQGTAMPLRLQIAHVENALQRAVARQTVAYESRMVMLGSIVTLAPFLGLLGTVWGVMDAFGGMTGQSSATLQNLAPGVSGALLTTVAGLLVAIPSVFGYNWLLQQSRVLITELESFASSLADRVELEIQSGAAEHFISSEEPSETYYTRDEES